MKVLITGSQGYIGQKLVKALVPHSHVTGIDIVDATSENYDYHKMDIRDPALSEFMQQQKFTHVVHLASILQPSDDPRRDYDIDVNGTLNVLGACVKANVNHLTVTSSGAAYGYHADNPDWLSETDALRGNPHFAYSHHKRLIENMLADCRTNNPDLQQLILRPGTVLGANTNNLITNLFRKKRILAIRGSRSPFVFILDEDVAEIILQGVQHSKVGIYNLAGDGALSIQDIAAVMNKPLLTLPAGLLQSLLWIGNKLGISSYGPEQLDFLRYRPVLSNKALKEQFGFVPSKTSKQVFEFFVKSQGLINE
ncbi:SDR family oxidoreductase [uncultured Paraglaciecola sp.]|jgi:UDP-glucose 4-epimerase|uniref:SDR family oxidoreductase n=1 Tax=uncultured Paraglaciecola sp. TaxID=1765024 RepID=UPI0025F3904F|nr:SDR family oxidoreductase [uncultured Paraglaciecola sp.]